MLGNFLLGLLVVCFGIPVATLLALPYPIKLALKIIWKAYCIAAALLLCYWALSPLYHLGVEMYGRLNQ
jgi:hypothetical protein